MEALTRRRFLRLGAAGAAAGLLARPTRAAIAAPVPIDDLTFLPETLTVIRRGDWRSARPKLWMLRAAGAFKRMTVHHQGARVCTECAVNAVMADVDAIYAGHFGRRYGDIGYHFVVDFAGRVWEGRSLAYEGAHVESQNVGNIGILLLGNYEEQTPSTEAVQTLVRLTGALRGRFGVPPHGIYGHRDLGASVCPGKRLYPYVAELRTGALSDVPRLEGDGSPGTEDQEGSSEI